MPTKLQDAFNSLCLYSKLDYKMEHKIRFSKLNEQYNCYTLYVETAYGYTQIASGNASEIYNIISAITSVVIFERAKH